MWIEANRVIDTTFRRQHKSRGSLNEGLSFSRASYIFPEHIVRPWSWQLLTQFKKYFFFPVSQILKSWIKFPVQATAV